MTDMTVYALAMTALRRCWSYYSVISVLASAILVRYLIRRYLFVRNLSNIPGPPAIPILGNALSLLGGQDEFYRLLLQYGRQYGSIFKVWVGMRPFVFISNPSDVQPLLNSHQNLDKSFEYNFLHDFVGTGLITSTGSKWHSRRKLLTPTFHYSILEDFVEPIKQQCDVLLECIQTNVGKGPFNMVPYSKLCALDVICVTAMGKHVNAQRNGNQDYVRAIDGLNSILQRRFITPWLKPDFIFKRTALGKQQEVFIKTIHGFVDKVIKEKKAVAKINEVRAEEGKKQRKAFLDLVLECAENGEVLSDEDVREEVNTFMFAGHDTTSVAISWSLFVLGKQPEAQKRIIEEFEQTVQSEVPTIKELQKLEYLERCVKESMRLFPVVPLIARDITHELKLSRNRVLVPGVTALIHTPSLHRDPEFFKNPDDFDPDRFLPENSENRNPFVFIPFSAGPRNCIGSKFAMMEIKLVLTTLLKHFIVKSVDSEEDLNLFSEIVLSNKDGVRLTIEARA